MTVCGTLVAIEAPAVAALLAGTVHATGWVENRSIPGLETAIGSYPSDFEQGASMPMEEVLARVQLQIEAGLRALKQQC
jgi:hypothetical protein